MVQDQLVEYINSQMKAGVSRDSIKNTLVSAGWQAVDVEDTLKKVESAKTAQPAAAVGASTAAAVGASSTGPATSTKPAGPQPQTIKISDLISGDSPMSTSASKSGTSSSMSSSASSNTSNAQKVFTGSKPMDAKPNYAGTEFPAKSHSGKMGFIAAIVIAVIFAGLAGYFYWQNSASGSQIAALNTKNTTALSQLTALQNTASASTTALNSQLATVNSQNAELQTELSFYATPTGAPNTNATTTGTITGIVSGGGKTPFLITATYGAKVYVSNSKASSTVAELTPLAASSTSASFTGSYVPGTDSITITSVKANQ